MGVLGVLGLYRFPRVFHRTSRAFQGSLERFRGYLGYQSVLGSFRGFQMRFSEFQGCSRKRISGTFMGIFNGL